MQMHCYNYHHLHNWNKTFLPLPFPFCTMCPLFMAKSLRLPVFQNLNLRILNMPSIIHVQCLLLLIIELLYVFVHIFHHQTLILCACGVFQLKSLHCNKCIHGTPPLPDSMFHIENVCGGFF